jgi:integrase
VTDVLDLSWQLQRLKKTDVDGKPDVPADYEYRHITGGLYWTRPKSNTSWRIVPLVDPLKSILARHIETTPENPWGLMFIGDGHPIDPAQASRDWRTDLAAAGIHKDVRLHDARHTTVDLLYAAGVPEDLVVHIVGHSTRTMTRAYKSRVDIDRVRSAMTQLSALFTPPETERTREIGA